MTGNGRKILEVDMLTKTKIQNPKLPIYFPSQTVKNISGYLIKLFVETAVNVNADARFLYVTHC